MFLGTTRKLGASGVTIVLPAMEIVKMIAELRSERTAIEHALAVLERLARGQGKRRGRPPAWLTLARGSDAAVTGKKKRVLSAEVRKKMADAQKKRWAAYRRAKTSSSK